VITHLLVVAAVTALLTWIVCRWWYRRRLSELRKQFERDLPIAPPSEFSTAPGATNTQASVAALSVDRQLGSSPAEGEWNQPRPFLNTSPLTHEVADQTPGMNDKPSPEPGAPGETRNRDKRLHGHQGQTRH